MTNVWTGGVMDLGQFRAQPKPPAVSILVPRLFELMGAYVCWTAQKEPMAEQAYMTYMLDLLQTSVEVAEGDEELAARAATGVQMAQAHMEANSEGYFERIREGMEQIAPYAAPVPEMTTERVAYMLDVTNTALSKACMMHFDGNEKLANELAELLLRQSQDKNEEAHDS